MSTQTTATPSVDNKTLKELAPIVKALQHEFPEDSKILINGRGFPVVSEQALLDRLDQVLGFDNWEDEYDFTASGVIVCALSVTLPTGQSVRKKGSCFHQSGLADDRETPTSAAFRAACAKYGIGRSQPIDAHKAGAKYVEAKEAEANRKKYEPKPSPEKADAIERIKEAEEHFNKSLSKGPAKEFDETTTPRAEPKKEEPKEESKPLQDTSDPKPSVPSSEPEERTTEGVLRWLGKCSNYFGVDMLGVLARFKGKFKLDDDISQWDDDDINTLIRRVHNNAKKADGYNGEFGE